MAEGPRRLIARALDECESNVDTAARDAIPSGTNGPKPFSLNGKRVFVAGHKGMVGSSLVRRLAAENCEVLTAPRAALDLRDPLAVLTWMKRERPEAVFDSAARVGGILANDTRPAEFLHENLMIEGSIVDAAYRAGVEKMVFLGSSCIYPRLAPQPISEDALLTGPLEPTNEWYAIAKIAGIKMAQAYREQYGFSAISVMPTNLYGPGDNFDLESSHVVPALIRKFHEACQSHAPEVVVWGTGSPRREFLHVDDLADAAVFLMETYDLPGIVNIGAGEDQTIAELAELIRRITGYSGGLEFDHTKPDGTPRKLLDVSRLSALGWKARIPLQSGIENTYRWYLDSSTQ